MDAGPGCQGEAKEQAEEQDLFHEELPEKGQNVLISRLNLTLKPVTGNRKDVVNIIPVGGFTRRFFPLLLLCLCLVLSCAPSPMRDFADKVGSLTVDLQGFRNDQGVVILSLYAGEKGFPDEMGKAWRNLTVKVVSGRARAVFVDVPYGQYALSILHDEDDDGRMKSSWLGTPLEGFGFSGRADLKFGPPVFADTAFLFVSPSREMSVSIRYETARSKRLEQRKSDHSGKP